MYGEGRVGGWADGRMDGMVVSPCRELFLSRFLWMLCPCQEQATLLFWAGVVRSAFGGCRLLSLVVVVVWWWWWRRRRWRRRWC